jgi:hypothetical protein
MGDQDGVAFSLIHLGNQKRQFEKDYTTARACYEESLSLLHEVGNESSTIYVINNLGNLALQEGDYATAHSLLKQGLETFRDRNYVWGIIYNLEALAAVAAYQDRPERALRLAAAAKTHRDAYGVIHPPVTQALLDNLIGPAVAALDKTKAATAWAEGGDMSLEQAVMYALDSDS